MAISDISLTAGMRSNLVSLQGTVDLLNRTQERLATGKRVNSPLDNATNYFVAKSHMDRAGDLSVRKDGMGEAIQTVKAANAGITAITDLIASAKGIAQSALSAGTTEAATLATQFNAIRRPDRHSSRRLRLQGDKPPVRHGGGADPRRQVQRVRRQLAHDHRLRRHDIAGLSIAAAASNWATAANITRPSATLDTALTT